MVQFQQGGAVTVVVPPDESWADCLELGDRGDVVYRTSRLIGAAAIALALLRLMAVVSPTETGAPWQVVIGAAALLAAGVTWAALGIPSSGLAPDPGECRRSGRHGHQGGGTAHGTDGGPPRSGHRRSSSPRAHRRRRPGPIRRPAAGARGRAGGTSGGALLGDGGFAGLGYGGAAPAPRTGPPLLLGLNWPPSTGCRHSPCG